ncbi:hypothetical protein [Catenulispora sp. GP43]|uniref:hypothetical protein n=1 Tax=Catenulispora sp. GP43 TaxID=3156263 RepID=UPI00351161AB
MRVLIKPRSVARLAVAATVVLSLAPAAAAATAPKYDLCDGHKWSLFGCRHSPAHFGMGRPDAEHLPPAED